MTIINKIENEINKALKIANIEANAQVEKSKANGDFSSNIALTLAKKLKKNPMEIAEEIKSGIKSDMFTNIEIANPGFINFYLDPTSLSSIVLDINKQKENYGKGSQGKYLNVEYVSANPTGHLHVGHARGAVYGNVLINIFRFAGNKTDSEYYINDAGNQIDILGKAVHTRYLQELGVDIEMPENTYRGAEVIDVAKGFVKEFGDKYKDIPFEDVKDIFKTKSKIQLLDEIKNHLEQLGVVIDIYTSEEKLILSKTTDRTIDKLKKVDALYEKDGALWIKTEAKGDDKDRVVVKKDGVNTYLGSDIANHDLKLKRGYDKLIDVWGADHVGQIKRVQVSLEYLGYPENSLDIPMIQLVKLQRDGKEVKMSKRAGTSYRLIDLVQEAGKDAARWFMLSRANESQFTLDLEVITKKTNDNPLFTVQYSHARSNQLINKSTVKEAGELVFTEKEKDLIIQLQEFGPLIDSIAKSYKVHLLPTYLLELAKKFNSWYSNNKAIGAENEASLIVLTKAVKQILENGLSLLGIEAPDKM